MRRINRHSHKKGSSSLEGAIAFAAVLVFVTAMINIIAFVRADIMMQRSCEQTAERISLLIPGVTSAGDLVSTVANAIPQGAVRNDVAAKAGKAVAALGKIGIAADDLTGGSLRELILEGILAERAAGNIKACYIERNNGSSLMAPDYINILFDIDETHNVIYMTCDYKIPTILGDVGRSVETVIPVYGGFEKAFIEFLDRDGEVERYLKINESQHSFAVIYYMRKDGLMATYHPDFIVGTERKIYLIETKGNDKLFDKNVRQKQTAAVEWARKINELKPKERMDREWEYVLVSEDNFYGLSANGATITDICDRCKVSLSAAMGELFV